MPETELWQAVLKTAVDDALLGPVPTNNRQSFLSECRQARTFLTNASNDLAMICSNAGLDPRAVLERMRIRVAQAPSPEELLDLPRQRRDAVPQVPKKAKPVPFKDRPFTINGETRTAAEWCARTGISMDTARARLNQAWSPERAFTLTRAEVRREHRARVDQSYRATMQRTGQTRRRRAARASTPRYEHDGQSLTLLEWSDRTGIKKSTLYKRVVLSGWSIGEALTINGTRHHRFSLGT